MHKQFGGRMSKAHAGRYARSANWDGKKFVNLEETTMQVNLQTLPTLLYKQIREKAGREPQSKIPVLPFDREQFLSPSDRMKFIWYGHSVVLMRMQGKTLLIDPMFGPNAAPIAPFPVRRFSDDTLSVIDQLPDIDLVLLTHDHYDHLDLDSIQKLQGKVGHYFVALGVGRHLIRWGIPEAQITEFDWWEDAMFEDIRITFTPTRHFSGRGLTDRAKSLWGGWVFRTETENIWFSGDGGYGRHFEEIGRRLGPFDFGFMECGQYNEYWAQIHMFPEESVQAGIDAGARRIMPVHWGGFSLAQHTWTDPVERFVRASVEKEMAYMVPPLGAVVGLERWDQGMGEWWMSKIRTSS